MRVNYSALLVASLAVLFFAFLLSLFISVGVFYGEDYHVVVVLDANPQQYISLVLVTVVCGIMPISLGIVLLLISLRRRDSLLKGSKKWAFFAIGELCIVWGFLYLRASYVSYFDAIDLASRWSVVGKNGQLLAIYSSYGLIGCLWLLAGFLSILLTATRVFLAPDL